MQVQELIAMLQAEVLPTLGCTEPGAVALAAAYAAEALPVYDRLARLEVVVNPNVYKNGAAVGIPGTGETGLAIAAALGGLLKQPERQLAVLAGVTPGLLSKARYLVACDKVVVAVDESRSSLWIEVRAYGERHVGEAVIANRHTQLLALRLDGVLLSDEPAVDDAVPALSYRAMLRDGSVTVADLIAAVEAAPLTALAFIRQGIEMNVAAAEVGIAKKLGMGIGAMYAELVEQGQLSDDLITYARRLTAAAADARMSGENVPVMSSAGSGNHGITVILPVYAVAERLAVTPEQMVRAVAISHAVTVYIKAYTGSLSALCGCAVAAATGATAAISWLLGGDRAAIGAAMKNIIANLTGMICDGGKVGCALKLSTAAAAAVESALLAQRGLVVPDTNGIIADTIEETVRNLGQISNPGMVVTDKVILDVMLAKERAAV